METNFVWTVMYKKCNVKSKIGTISSTHKTTLRVGSIRQLSQILLYISFTIGWVKKVLLFDAQKKKDF